MLASVAVHAALLLAPGSSYQSAEPPAPVTTIVQVQLVGQTRSSRFADEDLPTTRMKAAARVASAPAAHGVETRATRIESEVQVSQTEDAAAASGASITPLAPPSGEREKVVVAVAAPREARAAFAPVTFLHAPEPDYPQSAREEGEEGLVVLRVRVSREGRPLEARIISSSGVRALDAAAVAGVGHWTFVPAREGNEAIESWMDIPIRFRLR